MIIRQCPVETNSRINKTSGPDDGDDTWFVRRDLTLAQDQKQVWGNWWSCARSSVCEVRKQRNFLIRGDCQVSQFRAAIQRPGVCENRGCRRTCEFGISGWIQ